MDVNEHERETIKHYTQTQIKVKEQLVVRKDMDVNEHERETIKHYTQTQIKVKEQNCYTLHSHSGIFNNDNNSYSTLNNSYSTLNNSLNWKTQTTLIPRTVFEKNDINNKQGVGMLV